MLLKLTCPACGRSDQASDRVIGKEIRCPCGATFRVLGPKQGSTSPPNVPAARPQPASPQYTVPLRQPESRSQPSSSRHSDDDARFPIHGQSQADVS